MHDARKSHGRGKRGLGRLIIILGLDEKKLRLLQIDVGEAGIEPRFQLIFSRTSIWSLLNWRALTVSRETSSTACARRTSK